MNSQQNPTGPQGQEPEAARSEEPRPPAEPVPGPAEQAAPSGPATTTPGGEARAAQVGTDVPRAEAPAGQPAHPAPAVPSAHPAEPAPTAQTPQVTQQLPAHGGGTPAPAIPPSPATDSTGPQAQAGASSSVHDAPRAAHQPGAPSSSANDVPHAAHQSGTASPSATDLPQAAHQPGHAAPSSSGSGSFQNPYALPTGVAQKPRRDNRWVPVVSAAAIAALLASAGTAGAISLFDGDTRSASLADVGPARQQNAVPVSSDGESPDWQAVTAAVQDSVVSIQVATQSGGGEGSGVIIDAEGHILTNNHVVAGAEQVQVTLSDGRLLEAEVVGTDPTTDLAVIRLQDPPDDLSPATIGDSDAVTTGDPVMAIGNPLGLAGTATTGIISALNRPVTASAEDGSAVSVTNAVQTDAAVNPGNSGGPLFTANGEVIGINSSILTLSGGMGGQSGSIGLGFAIPSNLAAEIGRQLIEDGTAEHAFLGVSLSDGTATADGVTRRGARIEQIVADSPAQEAGLEVGEVVVAIGEDAVDGMESLTAFVREYGAGDETTVTVVGEDGETREVDVTLAVLDAEQGSRQEQQQPQLPGQDGMSGQEGSEGSDGGGSGGDQSDPGNIPDWLLELFGN